MTTKEQWFWEQCGFTRLPYGNREYHFELTKKVMNWLPPDKRGNSMEYLPPIDLNSLFKCAVPKVRKVLSSPEVKYPFHLLLQRWVYAIAIGDKDPTDSLFEILYKAFGGVE